MQQQGVPLSEAAKVLGVTVDVVRKRVKRGSLPAHKGEDGRWYVVLDDLADQVGNVQERVSDTGRTELEAIANERAAYQKVVANLEAEVGFLRRELASRTEELTRRDVLLREALQRPVELALPASSSAVSRQHDLETPQHRTWWQRLFSWS